MLNVTATDIYEALKRYRCHFSRDEDGDGLPLADVLSTGDETIKTGDLELKMIAEAVVDELFYRNQG
jgi:hypothetical protein